MRFIEVTKEQILEEKGRNAYNRELKLDLLEFLATGYEYAEVRDDQHHYNNNNDLRRVIQGCIEYNDLPITVFMHKGVTYVQRL